MASKNRVNLLGNLGRDPEVRYTPEGKAMATISLATSEIWRDRETGERKERTEWHRVVFFDKLAEICGEYLCKGSTIDIEGKLRTRKWTDKDGFDKYSTEILVKELLMLGGKRKEGRPEGKVPADTEDGDDIPF